MTDPPSQMPGTAASTPSSRCAPSPAPVIDSRDLLRGHAEIVIHHGGDHYRLRHTRNGKLILTK
jgi:hemin uptake protein HemP